MCQSIELWRLRLYDDDDDNDGGGGGDGSDDV